MLNRLLYWGGALLIVALGCWIALAPEPDPQLEKVQQLQAQLAAQGEQATGEQRGELFRQLREEMQQLTDEQRQQLWGQMREGFEQRMQRDMDRFFTLGEKERAAELDRRINEMESRRRQFEARRPANGSATGAGQGRPGRGSAGSPGDGSGGAVATAANTTQTGQAGPPGRGESWRNMSPEARNVRRKERLDEGTPKQRAQRAEYFRLLQERRKQRGLSTSSGGRWG